MSKSGTWLLLAFLLALAAYGTSLTIGFAAPITLIALGAVAAVVGIVLDVRARRDQP